MTFCGPFEEKAPFQKIFGANQQAPLNPFSGTPCIALIGLVFLVVFCFTLYVKSKIKYTLPRLIIAVSSLKRSFPNIFRLFGPLQFCLSRSFSAFLHLCTKQSVGRYTHEHACGLLSFRPPACVFHNYLDWFVSPPGRIIELVYFAPAMFDSDARHRSFR